MHITRVGTLALAAAIGCAGPALGACARGFSLQVLLDGAPRPEYRARGAVYVEAVRGRAYTLRVTNPLPVRVAVALAVDGLDTIDARHTGAASAAKWVLEPYQTVEIPGWQTDGADARRFFFTGERGSYGAWLGQTANLGVLEAVFYREKVTRARAVPQGSTPRGAPQRRDWPALDAPAPPPADGAPGGVPGGVAGGVPGGVPGASESSEPGDGPGRGAGDAAKAEANRKVADEYAATGIGERTAHPVEWVNIDLEAAPAAVVRIRYEFREQLARLGVFPSPDPLERREAARGFSGGYCPDPSGGW
jgi:hypothetical protein